MSLNILRAGDLLQRLLSQGMLHVSDYKVRTNVLVEKLWDTSYTTAVDVQDFKLHIFKAWTDNPKNSNATFPSTEKSLPERECFSVPVWI